MRELTERKQKQIQQEKEKREKRKQILREKEKKKRQSLREKQKEKRRKKEQILKAAIKLFTQKGFDQTTVEDIALTANVATGTYYNYFESKEDVILYFLDRETEASIDEIKRTAQSMPSLFDQLEETVSILLNHVFRNKEFARILMSKRVMLMGAKDNRVERKLLERIAALVDLAKERAAISSHIDSQRTAEIISSLVTTNIIYWLNGAISSRKECSTRIRDVLQLVYDGIGADEK